LPNRKIHYRFHAAISSCTIVFFPCFICKSWYDTTRGEERQCLLSLMNCHSVNTVCVSFFFLIKQTAGTDVYGIMKQWTTTASSSCIRGRLTKLWHQMTCEQRWLSSFF
jgi:hypothetical protein